MLERLAVILGKLLAPVAREVTRAVIEEWRRPTEGEMIGGGDSVRREVNEGVDDALDNM